MPKFDVTFTRQSRTTENRVLTVEAPSREEARALAWSTYIKDFHAVDWEEVDSELLYDAIEYVTEAKENQE